MDRLSEKILADKARNRDRAAMKELYSLYSGYLNAVCLRYIANPEQAKDILQDSFVKIFTSMDKFRFRGEGSLKAWMKRIVINEALKYLQRHVKKDPLADAAELKDMPDTRDDDTGIGDIPAPVIHEMIKRLPDGYRTVFNLYVFEDKSHKEIAALLGIRENSSASQLYHAKALLAKWNNEYRSKTNLSHRKLWEKTGKTNTRKSCQTIRNRPRKDCSTKS